MFSFGSLSWVGSLDLFSSVPNDRFCTLLAASEVVHCVPPTLP